MKLYYPLMALLLCFCDWGHGWLAADQIEIRIEGSGAAARYLGPGATEQLPVALAVGDTVVWKNLGNRTHTATAENDSGNLLFDTGDIANGESSAPIEITADLFERAGGVAGESKEIRYFCDHHGGMQSSLVVSSPATGTLPSPGIGDGTGRAAGGVALRVRRDITTLSAVELNDYRDAWRTIQASGQYQQVAGHHGCPDGYCHRPGAPFLPWHREYVLRMEAALGQPLHYWDWTSADAASSGLPPAFADSSYRSRDGIDRPNPLRAATFACPAGSTPRSTSRLSFNPPFQLQSLGNQVRAAYGNLVFNSFSGAIEGPHGGLHVWVGGDMGGTTFAAFDPVFWAHHSNVDRQWASWQRSGGPAPPASQLSEVLLGFAPRRTGDVLRTDVLGYQYDRYDGSSIMRMARGGIEAGGAEADSVDQSGIGKTFAARLPGSAARRAMADARSASNASPVQLMVGGIPEHPENSRLVRVFLNQPDATVEDAKEGNPRFAGIFGIFGGASFGENREESHAASVSRSVLTIDPEIENRLGEPVTSVTLVATDEGGAVVGREQLQIESATFELSNSDGAMPPEAGGAGARATGNRSQPEANAAAREFVGVSSRESYDEAYRDAVNKAQAELGAGIADAMIETEVLAVNGLRGGFAGFQQLSVRIRAWRR